MKKLVITILILLSLGALAYLFFFQGQKSYEIFDIKESNTKAQALAREVCARNAYLCKEFEEDEYCAPARAQVLVIGEKIKTDDKDQNQYYYLNALDGFLACTEKHLGIKYRNPADRFQGKELSEEQQQALDERVAKYQKKTGLRIRNQQKLIEKMELLNQYALTSKDPYLLYWSWSALGHTPAREALILADQEGQIESYDLQYFISQAYIKFDENRAKSAMYKSLRGYPAEKYVPLPKMKTKPTPLMVQQHMHLSIFKELMEIYIDNQDLKRAYLFAHLIRLNNDTTVDVDMVKSAAQKAAVDTVKIEKIAETYHQQLQTGSFAG